MKRTLSMVLAALLLLSLAACGGTQDQSAGGAGETTSHSEPTAEIALPEMSTQAGIEETVLVDEKDVKITATKLEYSSYDVELSILIENNSAQDLSFRSGTMGYSCNSVNGYMIAGGYLNADITAGMKSNETVTFDTEELSVFGITEIADICIGFDIEDSELETYLETGPRQVKTSAAGTYDYGADTYREMISDSALPTAFGFTVDAFTEEALYDQNNVRVLSTALVTNRDGEKLLFLEAENTGDELVILEAGDFCVNGLQIESGAWTNDTINPGCRRVMILELFTMMNENFWPLLGLDEIGEVAFSLVQLDTEYDPLSSAQMLTVSVPGQNASFNKDGDEVYAGNGVRIVSMGLEPDDSSYSSNVYAVFLVENTGTEAATVKDQYDSLSVNGFMTDYFCPGCTLGPGASAVLSIRIDEDSLAENGIAGLEAIETVKLTFQIRDGDYDTVDEPAVTAMYSR